MAKFFNRIRLRILKVLGKHRHFNAPDYNKVHLVEVPSNVKAVLYVNNKGELMFSCKSFDASIVGCLEYSEDAKRYLNVNPALTTIDLAGYKINHEE